MSLPPDDERPRLLRGAAPTHPARDDRAQRALRAIEEMFAATPNEEARAWARLEPELADRRRGAGFWLRRVSLLAAASVMGAAGFMVWQSRGPDRERAVAVPSTPAVAAARPTPGPTVGEAPSEGTPKAQQPPRPTSEAAPLAEGTSVISAGVRARLSRGGHAVYVPRAGVRGYLVLDKGTLELDSQAAERSAPPAADRRLEVRVGDWQLQGGGRFQVATHGHRVDVQVAQGEVAVWSPTRMVARVFAGERWTSSPADEPAHRATPEPSAAAAKPAGDAPDCLRLAREGVTDDAVSCLESQSAEPGLTGEIALLELARIRRDVKGDLAGAERLLADHERRFSSSGLANEARSGRIELLLRLGRPAEALVEAERLDGGEALYWRAASLAALGRRADAKDAFDQYLRRPDIQRRREATRARNELGP